MRNFKFNFSPNTQACANKSDFHWDSRTHSTQSCALIVIIKVNSYGKQMAMKFVLNVDQDSINSYT